MILFKKAVLLAVVACTTVLAISCAGTYTTLTSVQDETFTNKPVKTILVVGVTDDLQIKDAWESVARDILGDYEVHVFRAMDIIPPLRAYSNLEIYEELREHKIDAVLTFSVMDFWTEYYKTPEYLESKTTSSTSSVVNYSSFNPIFTVNTVGNSQTTTTRKGGLVFSWEHARLDVRLLHFTPDSTFNILWRVHSTTTGEIFTSSGAVIVDGANTIVQKLAADGFLEFVYNYDPWEKLAILGGEKEPFKLGYLNPRKPKYSIMNPFSHFAEMENGLYDQRSIYVSDTSDCSACNLSATHPPAIYNEAGIIVGYLTINLQFPKAYTNKDVQAWLRKKICKNVKLLPDSSSLKK